jgi:hypothetical protein
MDPQAAWEQLLSAYAEGDCDTVEQRATDLLAWLDRGGFPPTIVQRAGVDVDWNRALARAGCIHALDVLKTTWSVQN